MFDDNIFVSNPRLRDEVMRDAPDQTYRRENEAGLLGRELKQKIRKNIFHWKSVEPIVWTLSAEQLVELEVFLWKEAMEHAGNTLEQKLAREYITARMEPTSNYHRRQMCGEPLSACRANYCIHSNPNCASRKLLEHIKAIATVFDRRTMRNHERSTDLDTFMHELVKRHGLFGAILTSDDGAPIAAVSDLDQAGGVDHSDFIRSFYRHLEAFIAHQPTEAAAHFDLFVKAASQKLAIDHQTLILTVLGTNAKRLDGALLEGGLGVKRIHGTLDGE